MRPRAAIGAALAAYGLFLFEITQRRFLSASARPNFVPLRTMIHDWRAGGRDFVVDFLGNLGVFVPVGALLPLAWPRPWTAWQIGLIGAILSLAIEAGQFASGRRIADVDDLLLNTAGAVIGYALQRRFRPHPPRDAPSSPSPPDGPPAG